MKILGALTLAFIPSFFIICIIKLWLDNDTNDDNNIGVLWKGIILSTIVWAFIILFFMR